MTTFLVISESWFNGHIPGGCMFLGPRGVIAIDDGHCPAWTKQTFDSGELQADAPTEDEVKELLHLIQTGHARVIPNVRYMHVSTKVTDTLLPNDADDHEDEDEEM